MNARQNLYDRRAAIRVTIRAIDEVQTLLEVCSIPTESAAATRDLVAARFQVSAWESETMLKMQIERFTPRHAEVLRAELGDVEVAIREIEARD